MCGANTDEPLLVTAALEERAFGYFNKLREEYFPAELNLVPAHLSLFHRLPGSETEQVKAMLEATCVTQARLPIIVTGLRHLGRGVAFNLDSPGLMDIRADLARQFEPWLTQQDKQKFQPHVTVQNKVSTEDSRRLLATLGTEFSPWRCEATGLMLWRYLQGPWDLIDVFPFGRQGSSG